MGGSRAGSGWGQPGSSRSSSILFFPGVPEQGGLEGRPGTLPLQTPDAPCRCCGGSPVWYALPPSLFVTLGSVLEFYALAESPEPSVGKGDDSRQGDREERGRVIIGQDRNRAEHGKARQGKARQGEARRGKARQVKDKARPGKARPGKARQGQARQGRAKPGQARPGQANQARRGKPRKNQDQQTEKRKITWGGGRETTQPSKTKPSSAVVLRGGFQSLS